MIPFEKVGIYHYFLVPRFTTWIRRTTVA